MAEILAVKSLWWGGGVVGWVPVHRLVTATVRFGCDNRISLSVVYNQNKKALGGRNTGFLMVHNDNGYHTV